ncbi:Rho GTPase-activating protein 1, partial [Mucuna pruriens]
MTQLFQMHSPSPSTSSIPRGHPTFDDDHQEEDGKRKERNKEADHVSFFALLLLAFRKSFIGCTKNTSSSNGRDLSSMEIGLPSNVTHVAHVTFDRFNGFLGLPVEFEPEVPTRVPSARFSSSSVCYMDVMSMLVIYSSLECVWKHS